MEEMPVEERKKLLGQVMFGVFADYLDNPFGWPTVEIGGHTVGMGLPVFLERIRNFNMRKDDVIVASFPKSGTTWMQQIVYLLVTEDFEGSEKIPIDVRVPELELPTPYPPRPENLDDIMARPSPRVLKSHLPPKFLPYEVSNGKVVYVYRNPKDMAVSLYHHARDLPPTFYDGPFEDLANAIISGKVLFGPWHSHVRGYYDMAAGGQPVLLVAFEDMKRDRLGVVRKVAEFLGKNASEELIQKVTEATSFEAMKKNDSSNYSWLAQMNPALKTNNVFLRKGAVGDWKNKFTPELAAKFDAYVKESMEGCPLKLTDEQ